MFQQGVRRQRTGSHPAGGDGEHTVMGASHEATFRQYPLLNLCGMRSTSNVVVVGHGMVGHRFVEALRSRDADGAWRVTVLAEETDAAYDRVGLTGYTEHWDRSLLALPGNDYRDDDLVELRLGSRVAEIDRVAKTVLTADGACRLRRAGAGHRLVRVRAAGAGPRSSVVPRLPHPRRPRRDPRGRSARRRSRPCARGVVIGGGLLGLEAANALRQFGLQTHVVEMAPRLMAQQLDEAGGALLGRMIARPGHRRARRRRHRAIEPAQRTARPAVRRDDSVRVTLSDGTVIDAGVVVFAAGVRPRDELARDAGAGRRRARRRAHRLILCHNGSQHLRGRRGGRDRGPLLRPGRPRLHQRRGRRRPAARRRRRIPRGRHVDQAQAARRRRRQLRRRDGRHTGLPRGGGQRRGQPDLRQAGAVRRRQDAAGRHPGRRRVGLRRAAADGRRAAARRPAGADRAGRIRGRLRRFGVGALPAGRADLLVQQRHQGRSVRRDRRRLQRCARPEEVHAGRHVVRLVRAAAQAAAGGRGRRAVQGAVRTLQPVARRAVRDHLRARRSGRSRR